MQPQFPDEKPLNPFDFWTGADFVMKIRNVEGYRNYDKSEFKSTSSLLDGDDEKLETVFNKMYDLEEFTDAKNFKTYDELKTKLANVLGESAPRTVRQEIAEDAPRAEAPQYKTAEAADVYEDHNVNVGNSSNDEDDTLSYFARLAQES